MSQNVNIIDTIELKSSKVVLRDDGIIQYSVKPLTLKIEDAKEIVEAIGALGKQKQYPVLMSTVHDSSVNSEARFYAASKEANIYTIALAVVVQNIAQTIIGNTYIKINKPIKPTKLFTKDEDAIIWLKTFL